MKSFFLTFLIFTLINLYAFADHHDEGAIAFEGCSDLNNNDRIKRGLVIWGLDLDHEHRQLTIIKHGVQPRTMGQPEGSLTQTLDRLSREKELKFSTNAWTSVENGLSVYVRFTPYDWENSILDRILIKMKRVQDNGNVFHEENELHCQRRSTRGREPDWPPHN